MLAKEAAACAEAHGEALDASRAPGRSLCAAAGRRYERTMTYSQAQRWARPAMAGSAVLAGESDLAGAPVYTALRRIHETGAALYLRHGTTPSCGKCASLPRRRARWREPTLPHPHTLRRRRSRPRAHAKRAGELESPIAAVALLALLALLSSGAARGR